MQIGDLITRFPGVYLDRHLTDRLLKLIQALKSSPLGLPLCLALGCACFIAVALLQVPLALVLITLGTLAVNLTYRRLST